MPAFRAKIDGVFHWLNQTEIPVVVKVVGLSQPGPLRRLLSATNFLADGWIYFPLLLFLLLEKQWRLLCVSMLAVAVCFALYFLTKPSLARVRPCHFSAAIAGQPRCLDRYSFPSGHCMTLTVLSVLLSRHYTEAIPFLLCAMILLCWARIAAAYHYPSDLIAGIGIGVAVGVPLARILL